MLIGRAFCRLLAVGRLLNVKFCWFWLFLHDFHLLDHQGHPKTCPQKVRDKEGLWKGGSDPLRSTRHRHLENYHHWWGPSCNWLTCNSGVNFRNQYDCWSQWPIQCIELWSQFLLVCIWTSWKFIHHRMSVSNGWVLSLKIQFLLSIRVRQSNKYKTEQPFSSGVLAA